MRVGRHNKPVTLFRSPQEPNDADGYDEALSPSDWWISIQPLTASADGRTIQSLVEMRYHPQVTVDTMIRYQDERVNRVRQLFVRGVQDVDDKGVELRLLCEEVQP